MPDAVVLDLGKGALVLRRGKRRDQENIVRCRFRILCLSVCHMAVQLVGLVSCFIDSLLQSYISAPSQC